MCFPVLDNLVPDASEDWQAYVEYMGLRDKIYEFTLFWLFFLIYRQGERVIKSVSVGGMVLILGSLIDKVIFKMNHYMYSDVILVILSILLAIRTYKNERP